MYTPKSVTLFKLPYHELERLVGETWPVRKDWESVADYEWNNYCSYEVDPEMDDKDEFAEWCLDRKCKDIPDVGSILAGLISANVLPQGNYLITVYW